MKKILVMPDSFKGSLSAQEFCDIAKEVLERNLDTDKYRIVTVPMADGGEGTADCFLALEGFEKVELTVRNAYGEPVEAYYARNGSAAVVEMARAASLPSVKGREDPSRTTTLGVGDMIRHAVENGCTRVILGLGGSCTNDAGCGMAAALGAVFTDADGRKFVPVGGTLDRVRGIDLSRTKELLRDCEVLGMCDISNPLYGENGAAYVFAPQKGADREMVRALDMNLRSISDTYASIYGKDLSGIAGSGAAGGLGWGTAAFLGGKLSSGTDLVLDTVGFEDMLEDTVLVITGEGHFDAQSLSGKTVIGISRRAKERGVPVLAICGGTSGEKEAYALGVTAVLTTNREVRDMDRARREIRENLRRTVENAVRLMKIDI